MPSIAFSGTFTDAAGSGRSELFKINRVSAMNGEGIADANGESVAVSTPLDFNLGLMLRGNNCSLNGSLTVDYGDGKPGEDGDIVIQRINDGEVIDVLAVIEPAQVKTISIALNGNNDRSGFFIVVGE